MRMRLFSEWSLITFASKPPYSCLRVEACPNLAPRGLVNRDVRIAAYGTPAGPGDLVKSAAIFRATPCHSDHTVEFV